MNSALATDIHAALGRGIEIWHKDTSWPVSESEFVELNRWLDEAFDRVHALLDETWRDLFLADWGFIC